MKGKLQKVSSNNKKIKKEIAQYFQRLITTGKGSKIKKITDTHSKD